MKLVIEYILGGILLVFSIAMIIVIILLMNCRRGQE